MLQANPGAMDAAAAPVAAARAENPQANLAVLEAGGVLLADRAFDLSGLDDLLFRTVWDDKAKNVSWNPRTGAVKGARLEPEGEQRLAGVMGRYLEWCERLVADLLPPYGPQLERGKTSFRPRPADRPMSARKDDRRLHADAFPSQPVQGRRILRVFHNVNPEGEERLWHVGEPFADYAARFLPRTRPAWPGGAAALQALGLTKGRRSPYDALMSQLHDAAKADDAYQAGGPRRLARFAPGATWIVFTDATVHAALQGRYAFEQTFLLPVEAMADPAAAPLRVLERMTGRRLA